jgi:hypothetical protein
MEVGGGWCASVGRVLVLAGLLSLVAARNIRARDEIELTAAAGERT